MRSITLEILRDGPPHNQLLSPLTKYMALCGEHAAVSFQLGFEHGQWLARMGGLTYRDSEETRILQLGDVAVAMGQVIAQVPGLVAELTKCRSSAGPASTVGPGAKAPQTVQLRLVLNANELALLPLELAVSPAGFAAAGQSLALQTEVPLCITREIRRASAPDVQWRRKPRVLFAFANPGADVPFEQHHLALRQAVEPWVMFSTGASASELRAAVAERLTVLPRASLRALTELCAREAFTHVHILAHGVPYRKGDDRRFGLALHDGINPMVADIVDGERLAAALRPHVHDRSQSLASPLVVSLASCDGGNAGSVIGAGASIAHELHLKGVPLVVASQFPLTVQGSIVMVKVLYEGLLWGQDPRGVLDDLRRQLKSLIPSSHDWASLVVYSALPSDIADQSDELAYDQARGSIQAALDSADRMVRELSDQFGDSGESIVDARREQIQNSVQKLETLLAGPLRKLSDAGRRLDDLLAISSRKSADIFGLLAATEKRKADLFGTGAFRLYQKGMLASAADEMPGQDGAVTARRERDRYYDIARAFLVRSREHYLAGFAANRSDSWALVQVLVLEIVLDEGFTEGAPPSDAWPSWSEHWQLARLISEQDLSHEDATRRFWAMGNLVELHLLGSMWPNLPRRTTSAATDLLGHEQLAHRYAAQIIELRPASSIEVHSVRRQILRYLDLFPQLARSSNAEVPEPASRLNKLAVLAKELFGILRVPKRDRAAATP